MLRNMMLIPLKDVTRSRTLLSSILTLCHPLSASITTSLCCTCSYSSPFSGFESPCNFGPFYNNIKNRPVDIAGSFKNWFKSGNNEVLARIYEILNARGNEEDSGDLTLHATDLALKQLGLPLTESFVLEVLAYGRDVLSCLKFFDWAGRQPGFFHTRATYTAIFKILSKAKLMSVMFEFLETHEKQRLHQRARFYDTLIIGYAVARKPDRALNLFGRMRFQGLDLNSFGYHVLLNSLAENNSYGGFETILEEIRLRGHENQITHSLVMKYYCLRMRLYEAEEYLNSLMHSGKVLLGPEVRVLLGTLYENNMFERAEKLIQEFGNSGLVSNETAIGEWICHLVRAGRLDEALAFFQDKQSSEGYIPGLFQYNILISRLLKKNQLHDVYDLLMEMKDNHITPDMITMNIVLCFFCKAGMVDVALELYNSRCQFGLSPSLWAYNRLICALCGAGSVDEAYGIFKKLVDEGYFLNRKTFYVVANALFRESKVDEMEELLILALERNFLPSASTYNKLISALCQVGRLQDGYLIHGQMNNIATQKAYIRLITGFSKSNRGDIAARLLVEMRQKGFVPSDAVYTVVLRSLLKGDNPNTYFLSLLETLAGCGKLKEICRLFSDEAAVAKKPELVMEVLKLKQRYGISLNLDSYMLMLRTYLRSDRMLDALNLFNDLRRHGVQNRRLYNNLIIGLCRFKRTDMALKLLSEMMIDKLTPSVGCYENLVQSLCREKRYSEAINLVNDYEKMGRCLTSSMGNELLRHSLRAPEIYDICVRLRGVREEEFSGSSMLSLIIGVFSGRLRVNLHSENLEELIEKCFPLDRYTYNLLLQRASWSEIDHVCELFDRMCHKGHCPNQFTYNIMLRAFLKHGRKEEAKLWFEEMLRNGFRPAIDTRVFLL
ncbi:pentatricopeptide repeat-containing protein At1g71210, mitochondrial [Prosopis cineraria]|uniref:pentatricopeptide repeat-containing protein At1g71210, mitochondrial n=1 Tax=Prosopis cineraria TaxID=364024 RepID=UPI00240F09B0|nr:pentatricopeptide repeat-containing protein At1g71210, mitochondrial [Prosopis cineraria]